MPFSKAVIAPQPAPSVAKPLLQVIRDKCTDFSGREPAEVARCPIASCALWPYRSGHGPLRQGPSPAENFTPIWRSFRQKNRPPAKKGDCP